MSNSHAARAWAAWGVAVLFVLYLFGFQTGYSAINASIQQELGLDVAQLGSVAAIYTWSFAVFQLCGGALLDRLGARQVILPAIAIFTLGVFVFARAGSYGSLATAQVILALGACAGFVGAGFIGGQWFGMAKFSVMFGLVQCLASLFSAFNQNLLGVAVANMDWRQLATLIAGIGVVILAMAWIWLRDAPADSALSSRKAFSLRETLSGLAESIVQVARNGHVWLAAGYGALTFGALLAAGVVWGPKLMLAHGMSADHARISASVLWLGLAVGCIVVPWWSDAVGRRKAPAAIGILVQLAALVGLVYVPQLSPGAILALWLVFGFGAAAHMLAFSAAADVVKVQLIGTSAALVNGSMFLVSGLLISRPGQLAEQFASSGATTAELAKRSMLPLEAGLLIALILALLIKESHPRMSSAAQTTVRG